MGTTAPNRYNASAAQLQNCLAANIWFSAWGSSGTHLQIHHLSFCVDESNANAETLDTVGSAFEADGVVGVPELFENLLLLPLSGTFDVRRSP